MVDVASSSDEILYLNNTCLEGAVLDSSALQSAMQSQGAAWYDLVQERCPHLFAVAPVFISNSQLQEMCNVIAAVEEVVKLPGWQKSEASVPSQILSDFDSEHAALGVFYGYDFHLNNYGVHLIEVNTNAGGAFLNALLMESQRDAGLSGKTVAADNPEQTFVEMFRNEWQLERGDAQLHSIAIVDELVKEQYLYPELLLAKKLFEDAGVHVHIVDPSLLQVREKRMYVGEQKVDLIYSRLTDFGLQRYPHIYSAWKNHQVVLTPDPIHYQRYADKNRLTQLTDGEFLNRVGATQSTIDVLLSGVPETRLVHIDDAEQWWAERKQWFFKPVNGYGSKGTYRGANITHRVFGEIMKSNYVAQRMAAPGECMVCVDGVEEKTLKFDVRCYVYDGKIQLLAARIYQGQATNSRTPGGGFAVVRVVGQQTVE